MKAPLASRYGARLCEPVTVTLTAGTDAWVGRALAASLQICSQQNSRGPASTPKGAKFILEEEESCVSALLQLSWELKAPCCPSVSAAMPCVQLQEQLRGVLPSSRGQAMAEGAFTACVAPGKGSRAGTRAGCCSSQLECAAGVSLLLLQPDWDGPRVGITCDSNGLAYQAEGVEALKFGQNMLLEISGVSHAEDLHAFQHQLKTTSSFPPSMASVWILKVLEQ